MFQRKISKIISLLAIVTLMGVSTQTVYGKELEKGNPVAMYYREAIVLEDGTSIPIGEDYKALFVNGTLVPNYPIRTYGEILLVPLRLISEELGYLVKWDGKQQFITLTKGSDAISLAIKDTKVVGNKEVMTLECPPTLYNGITYVPLSFIADYLRGTVKYAPELKLPYTYYYDIEIPVSSSDTLIRQYPNVIIDELYDEYKSISKEEAKEEAQKVCREGLENFKKSLKEKLVSQGEVANRFDSEFASIEKEIGRMMSIGEVSRYYKFTLGVYDVLVDKYNKNIFFEVYSSGIKVKKVDIHDPELFIAVFIVG